jgi:putative flippase GtrA
MMARPPHWRQIAVFLAGGVLSALIDIGTMMLLLSAGAHHMAATSAGFGAGLLVNYAFHARVTFSGNASTASFTRYLCVVGLNFMLTLGCVTLSTALLDNPLVGKLLSLPLVACNGYLLSKYWIYK